MKQQGGKFLGSGTYGCVFKPHLKCEDINNIKGTVGKMFIDNEEFEEELEFMKSVQEKLDPKNEFTVPIHGACSVKYVRHTDEFYKCDLAKNKKSPKGYKQIIYQDAGKTIVDILNDETSLRGKPSTFLKLLKALLPILQGLVKLDHKKFVHGDIKTDNVMYKNGKLRLIDFGLARSYDYIFSKSVLNHLMAYTPFYPPEFKAYIANKSDGVDGLWKQVNLSFRHHKYLLRAMTTHLRMNPYAEIEAFVKAGIPKNQYKELFAKKFDIYSLGIILLELYLWSEYHEEIYKSNSSKAIVRDMVVNLIRSMLHFDTTRRASSEDAVAQLEDIIQFMNCLKTPLKNMKNKNKKRVDICIENLIK